MAEKEENNKKNLIIFIICFVIIIGMDIVLFRVTRFEKIENSIIWIEDYEYPQIIYDQIDSESMMQNTVN